MAASETLIIAYISSLMRYNANSEGKFTF